METDSCPAVDFPDNEQGGAFHSLSTVCGEKDPDLLISAFAYVLAKYTAQNESLFWVQEEGVRYPFYTVFDENAPAGDYLRDTAERRREAREHLDAEAGELKDALGIQQDLLLCFDRDNTPDRAGDWKLCLLKEEGQLTLFYRKDWYHAENMRRLSDTMASVAAQLPACEKLCTLSLIGDKDLTALESFPHWEMAPSAGNVPELLARSVAKHPKSTAIVYEGERLSYGQLDRMTDAIAARIAEQGIGRGKVVSPLLPRCKWFPVAAIAILKTGAAYQPLDPSYPPERLNFMVQDSAAALVVADRSLQGLLSDYKGPFLYTDELDSVPEAKPLQREIAPEDDFILLYTSGTTGTPKGVKLTHGNLVNFIDWYIPKFGMGHESRSAAYASFGFDANMMDTYPIWGRFGIPIR